MKKVMAIVLTLMLVVSLGCVAASAESGSKTDVVEIISAKDAAGNDIDYEVTETSIPWLTEEIASRVPGTNAPASDLLVLWQKDITAASLPATLTFRVAGMAGKDIFVYHHNGSEWELITKGVGTDVTATFADLSPVGIVYHKTGGTGGNTGDNVSPPTGMGIAIYAACGIFAAAGVCAIAVGRKKD